MIRRAAVPLGLVALALALAASSLALAASPSAWAKAADKICAKANADTDKLREPKTAKEFATGIEQAIAIGIRQTDALAKLPRPAAQAAAIDRYIAAVKANDTRKVTALIERGDAVRNPAKALVRRLGAPACAE